MARPIMEIANDLVAQFKEAHNLDDRVDQAEILSDEDKIKLVQAIVDTRDQIEKLFDEFESQEANA